MLRVLHTILFLIGLAATSRALVIADKLPFWSWSRHRHEHFLGHASEFNVLLIGTSRMNFGIVPSAFDADMLRRGHFTRTLNYAISGTRGADIETLVDWAISRKPATIKHFIVELCSYDQRRRGDNWLSDQDVELHTVERLPSRIHEIMTSSRSPVEALEVATFIAAHTACNALRIGQGPRIAADYLARNDGQSKAAPPSDNGFIPSDRNAAEDVRESARRLASEADRHQSLLAYKFSAETKQALTGGFPIKSFLAMDRRLREAGVSVTYVVMPTLYGDFHGKDALPALAGKVTILDLDTQALHESHYKTNDWFDPGHLSPDGAHRFSSWLSAQIASTEAWKKCGPKTPPETVSSTALDRTVSLRAEWSTVNDATHVTAYLDNCTDGDHVLLGVSTKVASHSIGHHTIRIDLPLIAILPMTLGGSRPPSLSINSRDLPLTDLYLQAAVFKNGDIAATSNRVDLPPPPR